MTDVEKERRFDGTDAALVLLTLGGVGGFLWLDHKLRIERKVNADLAQALQKLEPSASSPAFAPPSRREVPAVPAPAPAQGRNASLLTRLPRLELALRTYDDVFERRGRGLPVEYLRALALHESDMRPRLADGPAWGLMQVMEVVREDFNHRERANFLRQDLLDPAVNVTIAASLLALIIKSYAANHPNSPNMQTNWRNPQFVALVTFGWNAGWSERGGVGRVVSFLEQRGAEVNINSVFDAAKASGASPHLAAPEKLAFAKQVTRQYFAERADEQRVIEIEDSPRRPASDRPAVVVEVPSDAPAHDQAAEPVYIIETPGGSPSAHDSPGPITSPSQLDHEPAPSNVVFAPVEHYDMAATSAPMPAPFAAPVMPASPSGGSGPMDPYAEQRDPYAEQLEHYGYPEDPYAYASPESGVPHA